MPSGVYKRTKPILEETRKKLSENNCRYWLGKKSPHSTGEKHWNWKGDDVGYNGLHAWVRKNLPKPELCECCNEKPPLDLANKGVYSRDFKNWEYLCRSCHMNKDGRIKNLRNFKDKVYL